MKYPCFRTFVQWLPLAALLLLNSQLLAADAAHTVSIPDQGWRLWPDTQAPWKDDTLYLPGDFKLSELPVNQPTGGWDKLNGQESIAVTLPSTVEQHFWGKLGLRPYTGSEYYFGGNDTYVKNGAYQGVSWWWCNVDIPASFSNKVVRLNIRGIRQRAEVYVNHQLVGYDIIGETSFSSEIGHALKAGQTNQIAIRITNPGGRMDWLDSGTFKWGKYSLPHSHGFGGLDAGLTITAHDAVYIADEWVLNTPQVRTVTAHVTLRNTANTAETGTVQFNIIDTQSNAVVATAKVPVTIPGGKEQDFATPLTYNQAKLWDLSTPNLYVMRTLWQGAGSPTQSDVTKKPFGFRWFEPRGVGQQAGLFLNDCRVRLYTAISWGFWGLNGLWPTTELAEKEVRDAKELGMNMLNFHRDIGKEEVFQQQDKLGLLRYMEPGAGMTALGSPSGGDIVDPNAAVDTSGKGGEAKDFTQRYEEIKILRMIRQFRSHPSLVIYVVQNETNPVLARQPRVFNLLRQMHELDPSRVIAAKSGIKPTQQAWYAPYNDAVQYDHGNGYSGWRDEHTVGGPGVWLDSFYQGPNSFTHSIDDRKEIVDWGEMLGAAVADNHTLMVKQIKAHGGASYDLNDHQELSDAYHDFLDKWGFRQAFPTDDAFFTDVGNKCYEFWGKVLETARLAESNDILTISGWESTAIENHSGLVDNLRNFKGDPALISAKLASLLPVIKPHGLIHSTGDTVALDLYLLNETGRAATGPLKLALVSPSGKTTDLGTFPAPAYVQNQFVYPVKMNLESPVLTEEGAYKVRFVLTGTAAAQNSETIMVYGLRSDLSGIRVGLVGSRNGDIKGNLGGIPGLQLSDYKDTESYDVVIATPPGNGQIVSFDDGSPIKNTEDPQLFRSSIRGKAKSVNFHFSALPPGPVKVSLYFCDPNRNKPNERLFDIQINEQVVLKDFDIIKEANGKNAALIKTFDLNPADGKIDISVPRATKDEALINAIKIEAGGKVIAIACGGESYKDKSGQVWNPYIESSAFSPQLLERVRGGLPLLVYTSGESASDTAARQLAMAGAFKYSGLLARARASWMGSWVFVRKHPLYDGLPVNEVMKADYQLEVTSTYGLLLDGPDVEIVTAYGRDHDRMIGATTFVTKLGKGTVVFQTIDNMHPAMKKRWLENAVVWLKQKDTRK